MVLKALTDCSITKDIELKKGTEVEIVKNVVYINGYPVNYQQQKLFLDYINNNIKNFKNDTRNW